MYSSICQKCTRNDCCTVRKMIEVCPEETNRILHQALVWAERRRLAKQRYDQWHDEHIAILKEDYTKQEQDESSQKEVIIRTELNLCEGKILEFIDRILD